MYPERGDGGGDFGLGGVLALGGVGVGSGDWSSMGRGGILGGCGDTLDSERGDAVGVDDMDVGAEEGDDCDRGGESGPSGLARGECRGNTGGKSVNVVCGIAISSGVWSLKEASGEDIGDRRAGDGSKEGCSVLRDGVAGGPGRTPATVNNVSSSEKMCGSKDF